MSKSGIAFGGDWCLRRWIRERSVRAVWQWAAHRAARHSTRRLARPVSSLSLRGSGVFFKLGLAMRSRWWGSVFNYRVGTVVRRATDEMVARGWLVSVGCLDWEVGFRIDGARFAWTVAGLWALSWSCARGQDNSFQFGGIDATSRGPFGSWAASVGAAGFSPSQSRRGSGRRPGFVARL